MSADTRLYDQDIRHWLSSRHYFYVFLRPVELSLFRTVQNRFEPPVADFGCGDGFFASNLASPGTYAYGIDNNPRIVKAAQNVYQSVVIMRNSSVDLPSESIGTIISNSVFEHLHDPHHTLGELYRILQPGGRLFATVTLSNWDTCFYGTRLFGNAYRRFMRFVQRHVSLFDAATWRRMFNAAGFKVVSQTGYLDRRTVRLIERYHYLCLPSLAEGVLPARMKQTVIHQLNSLYYRLNPPLMDTAAADANSIQESPCGFFELEKIDSESLSAVSANENTDTMNLSNVSELTKTFPDASDPTCDNDVNACGNFERDGMD
jgi:SAM-dependent methyltransferase